MKERDKGAEEKSEREGEKSEREGEVKKSVVGSICKGSKVGVMKVTFIK